MAQTILEAIEAANEAAEIRTFSFADIREFNSFNDSFKFEEYPCHVVVPFTINGEFDQDIQSAAKVVPLSGWLLTRISEDTNDVRKVEIERKYMEPLRRQLLSYLNELRQSDIVNSEVKKITFTIRPEYHFLKDHLFGPSYTINLPLQSRVC